MNDDDRSDGQADVLATLAALVREGVECVSVTLASVRGSAPQEIGAKLVATRSGLACGTIGGGRLEAHALARALASIDGGGEACSVEVVNLQRDIGMTCGGEVTLVYELFGARRWDVVVFGAGHVAQSLVRLLSTLECSLRVYDSRAEWVERLPRRANLKACVEASLPSVVETLPAGAFVVVMTQGHATDLPVLRALFAWGRARYIGVMGSAVKGARLRRELVEGGVSEEAVAALRCPIGLKLGKSKPAEIAVSVAAELLVARDT
ncbi:MAG: xanthine dehydrogenase accessory protein XdhC [Myxococcales bacterium]|nr:xanthine dehydrogenase accessory protein XdhC [Myxococcales bacterium]